MHFDYKVEGGDFTKAGHASSEVKKILKQLGVDFKLIKRIVVALYEAEVNIVAHAFRGTICVDIDKEKIRIKLLDEGPGISDIDMAMKEGFSTASRVVREMGFGAGMGLANIKRNADSFSIRSEINKGTEVEIINVIK
jgi:serine/threonine-protein kinase RsbT